MKKVLIILETLFLIGACVFGAYTYIEKTKVIADRDTLLTQNTQLQQSIDAIGPLTTVYTVKGLVYANNPVQEDDLVPMTIPASAVPKDAITSLDQIKNTRHKGGTTEPMYYKVAINPQTMLTEDLLMTEDYSQPLYERDIYMNWLPIGLKANDCIDIRISYPDGTDLPVFTHKRVYMVLNDKVVKLKLTYNELLRYTSLLTEFEYYNSKSLGVRIYATAYIEPGLTKDTHPSVLYPVTAGAQILIERDPNVKNKSELINTDLRTYLDSKMAQYLPEGTKSFDVYSTATLASNETSALTSANQYFIQSYQDDEAIPEQPTSLRGTGWEDELINGGQPYVSDYEEEIVEEDEAEFDSSGLESIGSLSDVDTSSSMESIQDTTNQMFNDSYDSLSDAANVANSIIEQPTVEEKVESNVNIPAQDADGNKAMITTEDKVAAKKSENLFENVGGIN